MPKSASYMKNYRTSLKQKKNKADYENIAAMVRAAGLEYGGGYWIFTDNGEYHISLIDDGKGGFRVTGDEDDIYGSGGMSPYNGKSVFSSLDSLIDYLKKRKPRSAK